MAESPETPASPAAHSAHATPGTPATPATRATRQAAAGGERVAHVGLVGLGRMGRNVFRLLHDSTDLRLEAVSDAAPPATLAYLLRFDTLLGRFPAPISLDGDVLRVGRDNRSHGSQGSEVSQGSQVRLLPARPPGEIPWGELGIDTVIDAGEAGRGRAEIERHLAAGARRVFLTSQPAGAPDITVAMGVNDSQLRREHRIVCLASSTVQAAAPVASILRDAFGIRRAILTTVDAYTDEQRLADVPADEPRRGRAAAENIIPRETGDAAVLSELLPELRGKLTGLAMSVPVPNGSVVDLVCWHDRPVTVEEVNRVVREAVAAPPFRGILAYEDSAIVSSDILGSEASGTFDSMATMALAGHASKTLTWFDNSWGAAHRLIELIRRCQEIDARAAHSETGGDVKELRP
ncbi:MAG TPA: type I glyceraldehyde-3-phosphate dehydrogenase [Thermoanaerobaculia bacterium]|nr:type I glyceraldehyde-3-phosphate dehydrogenase [Thermoanaerobaculia bacterium]